MKNKQGFSPIVIVLIVVALLVAGGVVYKLGQNSSSSPNPINSESSSTITQTDSHQESIAPVLTDAAALSLVKATWGDCTPDTCSRVVVSVTGKESNTSVTATYEGLKDDSSATQRKVAVASYNDGQWTLGTPTVTQQCKPGRGHQDFSSERCI